MTDYMDKALAHRDPRFKEVLDRIGYQRRDMTANPGPSYLRTDLRASGGETYQTGSTGKASKKRAPKRSGEVEAIPPSTGAAPATLEPPATGETAPQSSGEAQS